MLRIKTNFCFLFVLFACTFYNRSVAQEIYNPVFNPIKGFVNETCVIKYNNYSIWFEMVDEKKKPFILIEEKKLPIFNLHIHSKNLKEFV